jgi:TPR repeat protein
LSCIRNMPFIIIVFSLVLYSHMGKAENLGSFGDAIFLFQEKMAQKGDVLAQYKLGTLYEFGISVQPDIEKARHWYQLAAKSDYQPAINRYTYLDIKANGFVAQKHNQWLAALKKQAEMSEPNAVILLGQMYHHGIGESKDLNKALKLLSHASSLGHTEIESEIDQISLEKDSQNKAMQQQKLDDEIRRKKQKDDEMAEKRRRYDEVMRKYREEQKIIDDQQEWVESQRKARE